MPQGQVIGRVSVRVLPDTDDFRSKASKQLEKIEKQLKVEVEVMPNMAGFERQMLTEISKINARNRSSDSRKVKLYTRIDTSTMTGELAKAIRKYSEKARSGSKVQLQSELAVGETGDIRLKISEESLRKMKDQLDDWRKHNSPVKIDLELNWPTIASTAIKARLGILTRPRTVSIIPTLNSAAVTKVATALAALSGVRVLNNLFEKFSNILKNLDKNVPIIGTLATAISGVAAAGLAGASNLFALSASLAQIGPTVALLPGLLGGFAVGLGVTIAALKDFNKEVPEVKAALSKLQDSISKNFWDKARAPIKEMVDELLPEFTAGINKTATQLGGFFGGLATSLKGALDPALNQMFVDLSSSINIAATGTDAFANIITMLGKVGTSYLPQLAQWFVNISKQFSDFLKAKGENGIKAEIDEGIQALKELGGVLYNTYGILSGVAKAATDAGGTSLGTLNDALASIHKTVDSPGFQSGLVDVFKAAHQAMDNIATQAGPAVKNLFIELGSLLTTVLPKAGEIIGTALSAVASALAQPAVTQGISAVFDGLLGAVQALAPAMGPLGLALGALMQVVAAMLPAFGKLVSAALIPLSKAFAQLAPMIAPIVTLLAGALTQAFTMLAPLVAQLVPIIGQALGSAFKQLSAIMPTIISAFMQIFSAVGPLVGVLISALAPILPVIAQLIATIVAAVAPLVQTLVSALAPLLPVLAAAITQILAALMPVVKVVIEIVTAVVGPLIAALSEVLQKVLPPLADAIQRVIEALQPFLQALLAIVNFIMPILVPILQFLVEIIAGALVAAINGVGLVLEGLVEIFKGAWNMIKGYFEIWWGLFEGIFTGNWGTFKKGFSDLWNGILGFLKGIWDVILGALEVFLNVGILGAAGKALKAISALWKAAWGGIRMAGIVVWDAIVGFFKGFGSTLSGLGSSMMSRLGSLISSGWSAIRSAATSAMTRLGSAISSGITKVVGYVRQLPGKAKSALGSLGSTLKNAGMQLIRGFISGITSMFGTVKNKLGDLTDKLKSWKGPESLDRVLLVGAGQLVINGFIKGLESRYDAVRKSLSGLTSDVGATEFDAPSVGAIGASGSVSAAVNAGLAGSAGGGTTKVLNYYAAPGSSLGSEEDLFSAANRARFGW